MESTHRRAQLHVFKTLVHSIPNKIMYPSSRYNLYNIIVKAASYKDATRLLYHLAKRYAPVRHMKATPISILSSAIEVPDARYPLQVCQKTFKVWIWPALVKRLWNMYTIYSAWVRQKLRTDLQLKCSGVYSEADLLWLKKLSPEIELSSYGVLSSFGKYGWGDLECPRWTNTRSVMVWWGTTPPSSPREAALWNSPVRSDFFEGILLDVLVLLR